MTMIKVAFLLVTGLGVLPLTCVVTCRIDKLLKVWDLSGRRFFNFEGHEAHVYSICLLQKENIQLIFPTAVDRKINAWLDENMGSRGNYHLDKGALECSLVLMEADYYSLKQVKMVTIS
ncbi:hypothetical protein I3843_15G103600 [Carya illinoinensis]|nr:hypothetical protein I3843_15G103600 [Carya illinoinensis]